MPETINRPEADTGLENKFTEANHEGKSSPEHKHEYMDFEDEVDIVLPSAGMTIQEMNTYATKKTAIQGLFNVALVSSTVQFIPEPRNPSVLFLFVDIKRCKAP